MGGDHIVDAIGVDNSIERNKVRIEVIFDSGGIFACLKHGEFFAVILHFLMGWGPSFFRFLGFVDFGMNFQSI